MRSITMAVLIIGVVFFLTGCETVKGMKKDLENGSQYVGSALSTSDQWMRENLW